MATAFRKYVPALLLSAFAVTTSGCGEREPLTGPTTTGLQGPPGALVTVEPTAVRAEFLSRPVCPSAPAFGVRIVIMLSDRIVTARRLRFELTHHARPPVFPLVIPLPSSPTDRRPSPGATPLPTFTQNPVPIPTAPGIPVPGSPPLDEMLLAARRLPVFLEFGCDVPPAGRLVATLETTDTAGRSRQVAAQVNVSAGD
jgi:hypothetical protein